MCFSWLNETWYKTHARLCERFFLSSFIFLPSRSFLPLCVDPSHEFPICGWQRQTTWQHSRGMKDFCEAPALQSLVYRTVTCSPITACLEACLRVCPVAVRPVGHVAPSDRSALCSITRSKRRLVTQLTSTHTSICIMKTIMITTPICPLMIPPTPPDATATAPNVQPHYGFSSSPLTSYCPLSSSLPPFQLHFVAPSSPLYLCSALHKGWSANFGANRDLCIHTFCLDSFKKKKRFYFLHHK